MTNANADLLTRVRSPTENAGYLVFVDGRGNCFLQNDSNKIMEHHRGEMFFSKKVVQRWKDTLCHRSETLRAAGTEYIFLIAPDKQSIFWDQISDAPDIRNTLSIFNDQLQGVAWVDPSPIFLAERATRTLYPLTDSHWDAEGAYLAYRALMAKLPHYGIAPLVEGVDFRYFDREFSGDLGNKFPTHRLSIHKRLVRTRMSAKVVFRGGVGDNGCVTIFQRQGLDGVAILFADSFGPRLVEFLAEHFGTLIQVHGKHLDTALVRDIRPDLVVSEGTERFMSVGSILEENEPTELLFIRKIVTGRITLQSARNQHQPLRSADLPTTMVPLVRRNEALTQLVLNPESTTEEQRWFMGNMPAEAGVADVLVASLLAIRKQSPLQADWAAAYDALPTAPRQHFEKICGKPPGA